MQYSSILM